MPVLDASVIVEYIVSGPRADAARSAVFGNRDELFAPHLIDAEVGHSLRRCVAVGEVGGPAALEGLAHLGSLPIQRVPHTPLLDDAWAMRDQISFYDALYVALARVLGTFLVTGDRKLARANLPLGVTVESI